MNLKQYARYEMNFKGTWAGICAMSMGLSFFMRILYYFGLTNLKDVGSGEILFSLILPLLLCCAFLVFFSILNWNAPGLFAIAGIGLCLLLIGWSFSSGSVLRVLLSVIVYILACVILLGTALGYFPNKLPASVLFGLIFVFRFVCYSFDQSSLGGYVIELSALFLLASLFALVQCFVPRSKK